MELIIKALYVAYEEEIDRQRELLDIKWKPELKLHRIDWPQRHVHKGDVPTNQQLWWQEMSPATDEENAKPPQVEKKKEQEELGISWGREQLILKQETDTFMLTPTKEENDSSEDPTLDMKPNGSIAQEESVVSMQVISSVVEGESTNLLLSHTDEKPYWCKSCGKHFKRKSGSTVHMRKHTGKKPYICKSCGKDFTWKSGLTVHMRQHTGERPYSCEKCGKHFRQTGHLIVHMRSQTVVKHVGKHFRQSYHLTLHMRTHISEKSYTCKTCGKCFRRRNNLTANLRIHTGEKPFSCEECGKHFRWTSQWIHPHEIPYKRETE
ncbi:zinc finger protein 568-like isoform X1 [Antennarius striatus]|uniref:zinc finger protein 568-like isoform X1 n=1 Tax=Antennarius striatus TaxID=241820 RepID=UPI0035AFD70D